MGDRARLNRRIGELLGTFAGSRGRSAEIAVGPGVDPSVLDAAGEPFGERDLAHAIRAAHPPRVVVVNRVGPALLRAIREAPPDLLVCSGAFDPAELEGTPAAGAGFVLGPDARIRVGPGTVVACAHSAADLAGLIRAVGPERLRLGLSPTPPWLASWLSHDALQASTVCGYVDPGALTPSLARWSIANERRHVLVPVGVDLPTLTDPDDDVVRAAAVAQTLERLTGPVFPSPRVIALVLAAATESATESVEVAPRVAQLWSQARRALPMTGAALGMERPNPQLALDSPTAAFLAQRAWIRVQAALALRSARFEPIAAPDDDGVERALEVLRSASGTLTDHESKVVLRGFGFEVTRQAVANSASGAAGFADRIGYPVVLKALSPDLRRRADVGGVVLALATAAAVRRAYATIVDNVQNRAPTARLDGVLVAEMLDDGLDIRCGGLRIHGGDVVLYGVVQGTSPPLEPAFAFTPLSQTDAIALAHAVISRAAVPVLRRQTDPDVPGLAALFLRIQALFARTGERVASVDLGPVRLHSERGYVTLDAKIVQQPHLEGL